MKKYNLILGLFISFFLISCASDDDYGESNNSKLVVGTSVKMANGNYKEFKPIIENTNYNHKLVVIDGKPWDVDVFDENLDIGIINVTNATMISILSNRKVYEHSSFGFFTKDPNKKIDGVAFSQGKPTENMPTTGRNVTYKGDAVIVLGKSLTTHIKDKVTFKVNFYDKEISGSVPLESGQMIEVQAGIEGNRFLGNKPSSDDDNTEIEAEGGFYGPNAKEMSGVFRGKHKGISVIGAFGGKK